MLSEQSFQRLKDSGKNFWDFFADWIQAAAAICAKRGVMLEVERTRTFLSGFKDPNTSLTYYDEFRAKSAHFPGAEHVIGGMFYAIFDGSEDELALNILGSLSWQSRVPIPPLPDAPPPIRRQPDNPVGPAIEGMPGYFYPHPMDLSPDGASFEPEGAAGPKYVKRMRRIPFGASSWWELVR
jgi:hypothetical protein